MSRVIEQALGALLILFILVDIFFTVLYARIGKRGVSRFGSGVLSARLARHVWQAFRAVSRPLGRHRGALLSFCGPMVVVLLVGAWMLGLVVGTALVIHPALGTGVRNAAGPTPTDFAAAMYAGASSLSVLSLADITPQTPKYHLLYVATGIVGTSVVALTLAYIIQIYNALQNRNTLGAKLHLMSAETDDAAELLAGLGAEGALDRGFTQLAEVAAEVAAVKESHHFYPVLFYFRFSEAYYSASFLGVMTLDLVSLIKTTLSDEQAAWMKESAPTTQLWRASMIQTTTLEVAFLPAKERSRSWKSSDEQRERWRRRHAAAIRRLRLAGVPTIEDERAGACAYVKLREEWDRHTEALAHSGGFALSEIDPAGCDPEASDRRTPFRMRRHGIQQEDEGAKTKGEGGEEEKQK